MNNIISQNFKNMLKNKIKVFISPMLYDTIDLIVENIFVNNNDNKYIHLFSNVQTSFNRLIKSTIISTFQEIDEDFKNSSERIYKYSINKFIVSRTLTTIVGTKTFPFHLFLFLKIHLYILLHLVFYLFFHLLTFLYFINILFLYMLF